MNKQVRANFTYDELKCKCGCNAMRCTDGSLDKLQHLRELVGRPLKLSSAYRCRKHNDAVSHGGTPAHPSGQAFDIECSGELAYSVIAAAMQVGFTRIGISQKGDHASRFVHVDDYPHDTLNPWVWSY